MSILQIQQHHDAKFRCDSRQRDEAHRSGHRDVVSKRPDQPEAAYQRERHRRHHQGRILERAEQQVEQNEYDRQRGRDDHLQPLRCSLQVFELP
jgi:hypothetical protein